MNWFLRFGTSTGWSPTLNLILGAILLLFPGMSGTILCWGLSISALAYAALRLSFVFRAKHEGYLAGGLTSGALFALFGLLCLLRADLVLSILPFVLGTLLLFIGIGKIPFAIETHRQRAPSSGFVVASALIPLVLGIILISNPFSAAKGVIMFFGLSLIIDAISDLSAGIKSVRK